jgi:hypothetical protein
MTTEAAETRPNEFPIPTDCFAEFTAAIAKINRKAKRLGCEPITFTVLRRDPIERTKVTEVNGVQRIRTYKVPAITVALHGETPTVGDHQFIAKVEYLSDAKSVLFHTVPGSEIKVDDRFRSLRPSVCEHCNKARLRKDTFIVRNVVTGEQRQVGRQCLNDFTGLLTVAQLTLKASWLTTFSKITDEIDSYWRGGRFANLVDTRDILELTSVYISLFGWTPKSAAGETNPSTAGRVGRHFWAYKPTDFERIEMNRAAAALADPQHAACAAEVIEWIKGPLAASARSDYEMNLVTLVALDLTEDKHIGIVCSAVSAFQRAMNRKIEYAKRHEAAKDSKPVGKVGERLRNIPVTVVFAKTLEAGNFGARTLVKFADGAGNVLTWFASGDRRFSNGTALTITATVKGHKDYNGCTETQVSRVKMPENVEAQA